MIEYRISSLAIGLTLLVTSSGVGQTQPQPRAATSNSRVYGSNLRSIRLSAMNHQAKTQPTMDSQVTVADDSAVWFDDTIDVAKHPVQLSRAVTRPTPQPLPRPLLTKQPALVPPPIPEVKNQLDRPRIIFHPVIANVDQRDNSLPRRDMTISKTQLKSENLPTLRLAQHHENEDLPTPPQSKSPPQTQPNSERTEYSVIQDGSLMSAGPDCYTDSSMNDQLIQPQMNNSCSSDIQSDTEPLVSCWYTLLANLNGPRAMPAGIGPEHVMNAPFFIETTQPLNNCRIRLDGGHNWEFPDRAEYFWAKTPNGNGPQANLLEGETSVNYQDIRFYIERGTKRFSIGTELPIRAVDPEQRLNSTGFGDMNLTTKALLLDGRCWQLSQIFRTYFPTGSAHRGTGNGHFSLEPGVAARYKWSDITYIHSDLSYWFPIAADLEYGGQILNAGIGVSHVLIDTDTYAVIPTLELDSSTVLDGAETRPGLAPVPIEIDTLSIVNLHPGVRIICDKGCDCSTKEFGISGGVALTADHWYQTMVRLEFRWTY